MFQSEEAKETNGLLKRDKLALAEDAKSNFAKSAGMVGGGFSCGYRYVDWVAGDEGVLFPRGLTEVAGLQQAGKTTLLLETVAWNQHVARAQRKKFTVLWVDFEHNLPKQKALAEALGVRFDKHFSYVQPLTLEAGGQFIIERIRKDPPDMVVVDTLATARPAIEFANKLGGTKQPGIRGKLWSEFFRNLMPELGDEGPAVVMINHLMVQLNMTGPVTANTPVLESPGSNSLRFYAHARLFLETKGQVRQKQENPLTYEEQNIPIAGITEIVGKKTKFGNPGRFIKFYNYFGSGISPVPTLADAAQNKGEKTGKAIIHVYGNKQFYDVLKTPGDDKSGLKMGVRGWENFLVALENNPEALRALAANLNETMQEQVEWWISHPKHKEGGRGGKMERLDATALDEAAFRGAGVDEEDTARALEGAQALAEENAADDAVSFDGEEG